MHEGVNGTSKKRKQSASVLPNIGKKGVSFWVLCALYFVRNASYYVLPPQLIACTTKFKEPRTKHEISMRLYLVRHGIAENASHGMKDQSRQLTVEGVALLKRQAQALARGDQQLDRLFTSPYRRARQTADILGAALGVDPEEEALLGCGCSPDDVAELLSRYDDLDRVMLVGHQPDMGRLIYTLTGCMVRVSPGTIAIVDTSSLASRSGALYAHLEPQALACFSPEG